MSPSASKGDEIARNETAAKFQEETFDGVCVYGVSPGDPSKLFFRNSVGG
jgi:hypothetical protein